MFYVEAFHLVDVAVFSRLPELHHKGAAPAGQHRGDVVVPVGVVVITT